jgi:restriction system protein
MTILDYKQIMLPLLRLAADGAEHPIREGIEHVSSLFHLTEEEQRTLLPSGQQPVIDNRVGWSKTYLMKAGLLESHRRGHFKITPLGLDALAKDPKAIDNAFLEQFPAFVEFKNLRRGAGRDESREDLAEASDKTPQELLEAGYQRIRSELADELLALVMQSSPAFFERLVVELLVGMGYGGSRKDAGEAVGRSGDGGVDGIIKEDKLGLDAIYIQAKRWGNVVGAKEVRDFVGSLVGQEANKGVFITTSDFTKDAKDYVRFISHKVILISGEMLSGFMIDYDIGVSTISSYHVKKADADYFTEE